MKKRFVSAILLTLGFLAFAQLRVDWSAPVLDLWKVESQIGTWQVEYAILGATKFDSEKLKEVFRFQNPSMSRFSIPYLTIMDIQLEAASLQGHPLPHGTVEK